MNRWCCLHATPEELWHTKPWVGRIHQLVSSGWCASHGAGAGCLCLLQRSWHPEFLGGDLNRSAEGIQAMGCHESLYPLAFKVLAFESIRYCRSIPMIQCMNVLIWSNFRFTVWPLYSSMIRYYGVIPDARSVEGVDLLSFQDGTPGSSLQQHHLALPRSETLHSPGSLERSTRLTLQHDTAIQASGISGSLVRPLYIVPSLVPSVLCMEPVCLRSS